MIIITTLIASLISILISIKFLLGVESKRKILKIGILRSAIKIVIGLTVGFLMALSLNATQHLGSVAIEIGIIGLTCLCGMILSLKSYQIMLHRIFEINKPFILILKVGVIELLIGFILIATMSVITVYL